MKKSFILDTTLYSHHSDYFKLLEQIHNKITEALLLVTPCKMASLSSRVTPPQAEKK